MRIVVLDDYAHAFASLPTAGVLAGHEVEVITRPLPSADDVVAALSGAGAVVLTQQRTHLPREVVARCPALRVIVQTGKQTSHLAVDALEERGVAVLLGGPNGPEAPAELTWALILASRRHLLAEATALREGRWQSTQGLGLAGTTLGVLGLGRIGARVAEVGRAFGMRVLALGREASAAQARVLGFEVAEGLQHLFTEADVLSVHVPLTPQTRGLVDAPLLALMKPTSLLVNTARAGVLASGALEAALARGRPGFAALDVFEAEPVSHHPLVGHPRVLCTPHLGFVTQQNLAFAYGRAIEALATWLSHGARPPPT